MGGRELIYLDVNNHEENFMAVFNVKQTSIQRKPKIIRFIYELVLSVKTITINKHLVNKTKNGNKT